MLADLGATILGPLPDWALEELKVPAFRSLQEGRKGGGRAFCASASAHLLLVLYLPAIIGSVPPDPDREFQARYGPSLRAALVLRMPDRIYLPAMLVRPAPPAALSRPAEPGSQAEANPRETAAAAGPQPVQSPFRTILIQPGRPIAADPRLSKLPSLSFQSNSHQPEQSKPAEPLVPGSPIAPSPNTETATARSAASQSPTPVSTRSSIVPESTSMTLALPLLPRPNAWSLVTAGAWGETASTTVSPRTARGTAVSVLAIASTVPQAGQKVEIPPVSQPVLPSGSRAPVLQTDSRAAHKASGAADKSTAPGSAGSTARPGETGVSPGSAASKQMAAQLGAQSGGKPAGTQSRATPPGTVRMVKTTAGVVEFQDLPDGTQQLKFPPGGAFDVVIVESTPGSTIPEAERLLTGRPVHTVFLDLGTGQDWTLQYALPGSGLDSGQTGMVVTLRPQPKLDAPFIQRAVVPAPKVVRSTLPSLFQGWLGANGRLVSLRPVLDAAYAQLPDLLPYLEQWQFRPVKVDGTPTQVQVLLLAPAFTRP